MLTAIIVAGGRGRRMGFDKTFAALAGKPVIAHTIAAFAAADCVSDILIVGRAERLEEMRVLIAREAFAKVRQVIAGGEQRQDSVAVGLRKIAENCDYVAVHDAARPLVRPEQIERVLAAARACGGAALAAVITDTLKRADADHVVVEAVEREGLYAMQTPQIFAREILLEAYTLVAQSGLSITDEVSALEHLGRKVVLVPNDEPNPKITFPADLQMAEAIWSSREKSAKTGLASATLGSFTPSP